MPVEFEGVTPIFPVRDLEASIHYFVEVLGFKIEFKDPGIIASVSRGRCTIFLVEGDQGNPPTYAFVGVSDVDALMDEYRPRGVNVRQPPTNYWWGYEMHVEDLDGNVLRFGSDRKEGEPLGEWKDMRDVRWVQLPDGRWKRVDAAQ